MGVPAVYNVPGLMSTSPCPAVQTGGDSEGSNFYILLDSHYEQQLTLHEDRPTGHITHSYIMYIPRRRSEAG